MGRGAAQGRHAARAEMDAKRRRRWGHTSEGGDDVLATAYAVRTQGAKRDRRVWALGEASAAD